jgi:hypothetical protein
MLAASSVEIKFENKNKNLKTKVKLNRLLKNGIHICWRQVLKTKSFNLCAICFKTLGLRAF